MRKMTENPDGFKMLSRVTVRESACTVLRKLIVQGGLPAGQPLHQGSLAAQLGISRTPLREALHTLSAEGLVTFDANGTAYVVAPSAEALREIYSIRQVLEILAGRAAVDNISEEEIVQAEAILDAMEGVTDPVEWASLNAAFHRVIYDAAGKPQLMELIEILRNRAKLYVALLAADLKNATHAAAEHRAMLAALRARDADGMEALIRSHLTATTLKVGANLAEASSEANSSETARDMEGTG
jgi:DNA-binding GntR family transcriptional regulator